MTFSAAENLFCERLSRWYDQGEARAIFAIVVEHFLGVSRAKLLLARNEELPHEHRVMLEAALVRLQEGEPVQYVTGEAWFCDMAFRVTPDVLIPRPETEELVDMVAAGEQGRADAVILDVGTGSGCIAVALKKRLPRATVWAIDVSAGALAVAAENARRNQADVRFVEADVLAGDTFADELDAGLLFDVIVSNPPYIPSAEEQAMHRNVAAYEPHLALFVPDKDALLFYREITHFAIRRLKKPGKLYFEIHENHGAAVIDLLKALGISEVRLKKDFTGRDRMIVAVLE